MKYSIPAVIIFAVLSAFFLWPRGGGSNASVESVRADVSAERKVPYNASVRRADVSHAKNANAAAREKAVDAIKLRRQDKILERLYEDEVFEELLMEDKAASPLSKITVNVTDLKSLGAQLSALNAVMKDFPEADKKRIGQAGIWLLVDAAMASDNPDAFGQKEGMSPEESAAATRRTQELIIGVFREFNGQSYYDMMQTILQRSEGRGSPDESWKAVMQARASSTR